MQFYNKYLGDHLGNDFNSLGHRCREFQDINLRNYILFLGDNIALGLGTPIEETYPYLVSKALNMDYYNLAVFNGGIDATRYNLLTWFAKVKSPPRLIVVSHQFLNSFIVTNQQYDTWQSCDLRNAIVQDVYKHGNYNGFFETKRFLADVVIKNSIQVPIYQVEFKDSTPLLTSNVTNMLYDGDMFDHQSIANVIQHSVLDKIRRARP